MNCPLCDTVLPDGATQCTRCDWVYKEVPVVDIRDEMAFWLSVVPGLGHLYKGHVMLGGLIFFFFAPAVLLLGLVLAPATLGISLLVPLVLMGMCMLHAYRLPDLRREVALAAREYDAREPLGALSPGRRAAPSRIRGMPKKSATKKKPEVLKDPQGGLTAAGRKHFEAADGSHLKPGVKKAKGAMSVEEMKRKGSWAARFYGRKTLPPLKKNNGEPTRFALTAAAWGEPIPTTVAAARKIAAKGRELLAAAKKQKA